MAKRVTYKTRRADLTSESDLDHLRDLHLLTFGNKPSWLPNFTVDHAAWWLVYASNDPNPVAFAGIEPGKDIGVVYMCRAGVTKEHIGHGLQRRLIRIRERLARKQRYHTAITDTYDNCYSSNNLIACGYRLYKPKTDWGFKGAIYFKKKL